MASERVSAAFFKADGYRDGTRDVWIEFDGSDYYDDGTLLVVTPHEPLRNNGSYWEGHEVVQLTGPGAWYYVVRKKDLPGASPG